jgi:hypothetical protein
VPYAARLRAGIARADRVRESCTSMRRWHTACMQWFSIEVSVKRAPGSIGKAVLLIMLVMMPLRASLGTGYQVMFAVQHEHSATRHVTTEAREVTLSNPTHSSSAQINHACCFQFTMTTSLCDLSEAPSLRLALYARNDPPSSTFVPDCPHQPPK